MHNNINSQSIVTTDTSVLRLQNFFCANTQTILCKLIPADDMVLEICINFTSLTLNIPPSQMTTPESRRVQTDGKASFLDNIGQRTQELEREKRETHLRRQREGGRGGKMTKTRKTPVTDKKVEQLGF